MEHVEGLAAEPEHHVDVAGREEFLRVLEALEDLLARAELLIALGELQEVIVEALHADRHAVDQALEIPELGRRDDLRVGFAGDFFDRREERLRVLDRLDELVLKNRRRAAADVHRVEVVPERLHVFHFLPQVHEVFARLVLLEEEAVEGAVRAERVAERDVRVEEVLVAFLRGRGILQNHRVAVQVALDVVVHHAVRGPDHPVGEKFAGLRGVVRNGHDGGMP